MNEWDKYREELERSKHDYCLYGPASLKLTLTPIIEDFNLPLDENSYWIAQHWQAMPSSPFGGIPRNWKLALPGLPILRDIVFPLRGDP